LAEVIIIEISKEKLMKIKILVTGGTFDKEYNELTGELYFKKTHVYGILKLGRTEVETNVQTLMMIDSQDMTDSHRNLILETCINSDESKIIITHGTDTMEITAKILGEKIKNKTIVLTGAMVPYAFGSSDGLFNMGSAIAFAQTLPHGVYIAMDGKYFHYNNVRKNKEIGKFEEIE